jgi:RluA family pseudouridine synthase
LPVKKIHPSRILYEDEHLLVVNKLAGELTVAAGGKGKASLYDFLHPSYPGLRVVHRLDYITSGIVVFARTAEALEKIRESDFEGWKKTYRAIVAGRVGQDRMTITKPLPARESEDLVPAVTHVRVLERFATVSSIEATIETGRKHQIRRHLSSIGHPLVLDKEYGDRRKDQAFFKQFHFERPFLHASSLTLPHPITGKLLTIAAPLPPTFDRVLTELRTGKSAREDMRGAARLHPGRPHVRPMGRKQQGGRRGVRR